ncbi:MAG TPA: Gfo/Idh/MocA family oxidoreductase [Sumerlaeia bacterium]|nr:Gfo/Idh/MocA family oxidoreductase [Sumerlaeia bacterium]
MARQNAKRTPKTGALNRREFLRSAAVGAAAASLPAISMIPASALGAEGRVAPSNRIVMGCIGVGGMGTGNMNGFLSKSEAQVVAVCDVDRKHRDGAKKIVDEKYGNADCKAYHDFRDLIGRGDLDAVSLALPDHWHAIPAIAAARAGLDMYGEKPLSRSIRESRAICDAVHRHGRIWQTGSWQRSQPNFRHACELVRNGFIGKVHSVTVGLPNGSGCGHMPIQPVPENLDWEFWLGPAPWSPYRGVSHWNWRWILDYSGGQLTDWAGHHIDIAHWGLGFDRTGPIEIEGKGEYPESGLYDVPISYKFTCKYEGGVTITVGSGSEIGHGGAKWYGEDGWVWVDRGGIDASDKRLLDRGVIGPNHIRLYDSADHHRNFLDCVKSRKETIAPAETACRSISVGHLGEIAMLTGRKIKWDPVKEEIIGDPGASALLRRSYREPWTL